MSDVTPSGLPKAIAIDPINDYFPIDTNSPSSTNGINRNTFLGVTGQPADTTTPQTLTNKTLTSPVVATPTVTGGTFTTPTVTGGTFTTPNVVTAIKDANGNESLRIGATANAVNDVTVTNAITGGTPVIAASGDDANVGLNLGSKGAGDVGFLGLHSGWIIANEAWTYASATTITVPSGAAAKYSVGDKIRLTQTTVKYFYITAVADTLLTVTGGSDYTLTNAAITLNYYSHETSPVGFPQVFNWSPTVANFTIGNGLIEAAFSMIGKTVRCRFTFQLGSTSSLSGAEPTFSLPAPASANQATVTGSANRRYRVGNLTIDDYGVGNTEGLVYIDSTITFKVYALFVAGGYLNPHGINSTYPMTWTTNDSLWCEFAYEAA